MTINCPLFHLTPDRQFLYLRNNYSTEQRRRIFSRKKKKSHHALKSNFIIEEKVVNLSTSLYLHYLDELPENLSETEMDDENLSPLFPSPSPGIKKNSFLSQVNEIEEQKEEEEVKEPEFQQEQRGF